MVAATLSSTWAEVSKSNPCPLCGKPDWCSVSDNGEAVLCRRTDNGSQPLDWKYIKDSNDGFPIFVLAGTERSFPQARRNEFLKNERRPKRTIKKPIPSPQPAPIPSGDAVLARLPQKNSARPQTNKNPFIPDWLKEQGVPAQASEIRYW